MQNLQHRRKSSENSSVVFEVTEEELENFSGGVLGRSTLSPSTSALVSTVSTAMSATSLVSLGGSISER